MKLHKIFIICALVHALPTCGAAAPIQKAGPKAYSGAIEKTSSTKVAHAFNPKITRQFYELTATNDPTAQAFLEQNNAQIDINYQHRSWGNTPFMWAARYCNLALVKALQNQNADYHLSSVDGLNALHCVFQEHNPPVDSFDNSIALTNLLLNAKININQQCTDGITSLMFAVTAGHSYAIPTLLERGADATLQGKGTLYKHPFTPKGIPLNNALQIAQAYKQHAKTYEQKIIGHHMIKTLEKHQRRTQHLNPLRDILPLDLILIIGKYDRG